MASWLSASRRTRAARALLALALSVPSLAAAEAPPATDDSDPVTRAEQYAAQAFEAYRAGRHADALALYERAYASAPSADALYNIARIHDLALGDPERAIAAYERCLLEPGASPERLARAGERIVELRRAVARALPAPSWPAESAVMAAPPPAAAPREPAQGWSWLQGAAVVSGAAGVVGLGVGIGFGLAATADARRANAACNGNLCRTQRGVDAAESASTRATLATVGVGVGTALLAAGATFWLLGDGSEGSGEAAAGAASVSLGALASTSELGMAVEGAW